MISAELKQLQRHINHLSDLHKWSYYSGALFIGMASIIYLTLKRIERSKVPRTPVLQRLVKLELRTPPDTILAYTLQQQCREFW